MRELSLLLITLFSQRNSMADAQRAGQLIFEDSATSRGGPAYQELLTEENDLEFNSSSNPKRNGDASLVGRSSSVDKGKGREELYDMDLHHSSSRMQVGEEARSRTRKNSTSRRSSRNGSGMRESGEPGGYGQHGDLQEKRRLRRLYWRAGAINALFILAWFVRSSATARRWY